MVGVDEHPVRAAEPPAERIQALAEEGVVVAPRVPGHPSLSRPRGRARGVVAERGRDDRASPLEQPLGMARDLRVRHGEPHRPEEPPLAPLPDVTLGLVVRCRLRGPDHVEPELLPHATELLGGHEELVTQRSRAGRAACASPGCTLRIGSCHARRPDPRGRRSGGAAGRGGAGSGRRPRAGARPAPRRVPQPPGRLGAEGAAFGAEAAHPRRRRRRDRRGGRRRRGRPRVGTAGGAQPRDGARGRHHRRSASTATGRTRS